MRLIIMRHEYHKHFVAFLLFILPFVQIISQSFELSFGGEGVSQARRVIETPDHDAYIVVDYGPKSNSSDKTVNFTKIDTHGNIVATTSLIYDLDNYSSIFSDSEGIQLVTTAPLVRFEDIVLLKLNYDLFGTVFQFHDFEPSLSVRWRSNAHNGESINIGTTSFGDELIVYVLSVDGFKKWHTNAMDLTRPPRSIHAALTDEGELIVIAQEFVSGDSSIVHLSALDMDGNKLWQKTYDIPYPYLYFETAQFKNTRTLLLGIDKGTLDVQGIYLMAFDLDNDGEQLWSKHYYKSTGGFAFEMASGEDEKIYVYGSSLADRTGDCTVFKINTSGNIEWDKRYAEMNAYVSAGLLFDEDHGLIVSTAKERDGNLGDPDIPGVWNLGFDGNVKWHWESRNTGDYTHRDIILTEQNDIVVLGNHEIDSLSAEHNYVARLDSTDWIFTNTIGLVMQSSKDLNIYPNPLQNGSSFSLINEDFEGASDRYFASIIDAYGRTVRTIEKFDGKVSVDGLIPGVYQLIVKDGTLDYGTGQFVVSP